jgi:hypothetical protein
MVLSVGAALTARVPAAPAETPRTVYISATDASGAVVKDLTAADIAVKEDGKDRVVSSVKPATEQMDIHIFVEDNGTGAYQQGVLDVLQATIDRAKFTITQFSPQAVKLLDASTDMDAIQTALDKLGRRGRIDADGEQIVEALGTAARALQQSKPARPVFLVFTIGGDSGHKNPDLIMGNIRRSGAVVNAIYLQTSGIGQVLGDSPRESGGLAERIGSMNAISPAAKKVADMLLSQYAVTYTLPDGVKPADRVAITTTRPGVKLLAPTRIPDR